MNKMVKCNNCKYCIRTIDGDEESFYGHSYVSNVSYGVECSKMYDKKFNFNGETDCKGFKERQH